MAFILLVRHGQNDWVNKNRLAGWIPGVHLNSEGRAQSKKLTKRVAHLPITAVYSSPLERCTETAAYVANQFGLEVIELKGIGEVRYGKWEGKKLKKLAQKKDEWYAVQHFPSRFRFPKGESFTEVQQRAVVALETLNKRHKIETIVVVSHADVIKLVLAYYMGVHIDLFQRVMVSPASVSALGLTDKGQVYVMRVNDNGLLPALQKPKKKDERKKGR